MVGPRPHCFNVSSSDVESALDEPCTSPHLLADDVITTAITAQIRRLIVADNLLNLLFNQCALLIAERRRVIQVSANEPHIAHVQRPIHVPVAKRLVSQFAGYADEFTLQRLSLPSAGTSSFQSRPCSSSNCKASPSAFEKIEHEQRSSYYTTSVSKAVPEQFKTAHLI